MTANVVAYIEKSDIPNAAVWLAEARFGYRHIVGDVAALGHGARILEIGCGSGILLSMLSDAFPQHDLEGIEPFGAGFSALKDLNSLIRDSGVRISICGYEDFEPGIKYELIYCVNVFEHVADWRHFLRWASGRLCEGGKFVVLCPNYGFPYESHFRIPVLWNKSVTHLFFKSYITIFEIENDIEGLWKSLNFVSKKNVKKFVKNNISSMLMVDEVDIIDDMVARLVNDAEFQKRQAFIGKIALYLKIFGIIRLLKLFPNFVPYMKLSFSPRRKPETRA